MMSNSKYNSQKVHYDVSEPMAKTKRVWRLIKIWDLYRTFAKTVNRRSLPLSPSLFTLEKFGFIVCLARSVWFKYSIFLLGGGLAAGFWAASVG